MPSSSSLFLQAPPLLAVTNDDDWSEEGIKGGLKRQKTKRRGGGEGERGEEGRRRERSRPESGGVPTGAIWCRWRVLSGTIKTPKGLCLVSAD